MHINISIGKFAGRFAPPAILLALAYIGFGQNIVSAQTEQSERVSVSGSFPADRSLLSHARLLGRQDGQESVTLAISLPLRNQAELNDFIHHVSDPSDPLYRHYLSGDQFDRRFGPTAADYEAVKNYVNSIGLNVAETFPGHSLMLVKGSTATVENAFGVRLNNYLMPDGRIVYANDFEPTVPQTIAGQVHAIVGLNNIGLFHHSLAKPLNRQLRSFLDGQITPPVVGTGPLGGLAPSDIKTAYSLSSSLKGEGQTAAVFELDGYARSDIDAYTRQFGLPTASLQNVTVNNFDGSAGSGSEEVVLDIDLVLAMAPKLQKLLVYEADNSGTGLVALYQKIADDNAAKSISTSWGLPENVVPDSVRTAENLIFAKMGAQGQSIFAASGDNGSFANGASLSVSDPASQPLVTAVGGTSLSTVTPGGAYSSETTWSGSGGGSSTVWLKPDYQKGPPVLGASATQRDVPDVSLDADPETGYDIFVGAFGGWETQGGTSASAPLWAGFTALVNQQLALNGSSSLGFANTSLYAVGRDPIAYPLSFHDILTGSNGTGGTYDALVGYDDATGLGTFKGDGLLGQLTQIVASAASLSGKVMDAGLLTAIAGATVRTKVTSTGIPGPTATTTSTGAYSISGLASGITYTVTVSATNYITLTSTVTIPSGLPLQKDFLLTPAHPFHPGLQMISAPYDYSTTADFAAIFGLTSPLPVGSPRLFAYDPIGMTYVGYPFYPADTFRLGQGYWVRINTDTYNRTIGTPALLTKKFQYVLQKGWNIIGNPFPDAISIATIQVDIVHTLGSPDTDTAPFIGASNLTGHTLYTFPGGVKGAYKTVGLDGTLDPWQGYWILANQPTTLILTPPGGVVVGPPQNPLKREHH